MDRRSLLGALLVSAFGCSKESEVPPLGRSTAKLPGKSKILELPSYPPVEPLTDELRKKGFHECNPHDPLGLGPYGPYQHVSWGRMLIPQKGGSTPDRGFDVIIHFHGADPVRKLLVQSARGVALVLVDLGTGGGPYARAFGGPKSFPKLKESIESALKKHCNDEKAHIRHLALSSWSAGYTAIDRILMQKHDDFDSIVILDGLHGVWKQNARREQNVDSVDPLGIERATQFAKRAFKGEKTFVLTHSNVDPGTYPSTGVTANLLLREVGLRAKTFDPNSNRFGQTSGVDEKGLHVWGFRGNEEKAHCSQIMQMPRIVGDIIEPTWDTPPMDRSVPSTPVPGKAGKSSKKARRG